MAQKNTENAFAASMEKAIEVRNMCQAVLEELVTIDSMQETISYKVPLEHMDRLNQFSLTYCMLHRCLTTLNSNYQTTAYLIEVELKRYNCVVAKINETLVMRTAIESELVFVI